jgi:hypothetical protein
MQTLRHVGCVIEGGKVIPRTLGMWSCHRLAPSMGTKTLSILKRFLTENDASLRCGYVEEKTKSGLWCYEKPRVSLRSIFSHYRSVGFNEVSTADEGDSTVMPIWYMNARRIEVEAWESRLQIEAVSMRPKPGKMRLRR